MYFAYSSGVTGVGRLAHGHDSHERLEAPLVVGCDRVLCRGTASLSARLRAEGSLSGSETEVDNGFEGSTILHKGLWKADQPRKNTTQSHLECYNRKKAACDKLREA